MDSLPRNHFDPEREVLTVEEAAYLLRIGRSRAYSMAADGTLPGVFRIGRSIRVNRQRLQQWVDEQV